MTRSFSGFDLDQRVKLIIGSSGVQPSADEMKPNQGAGVAQLIDEKLKYQEAKRLKVEVKDKEIVDQLNYIAQRNGTTVDGIKSELKKEGVSIFTLTDQIKVDIAWNELVQGRFGDEVIDQRPRGHAHHEDMRENSDKPQYDVLEIFLAVDLPSEDAKVKQQALDLIEQIKRRAPVPATGAELQPISVGRQWRRDRLGIPGQLPRDRRLAQECAPRRALRSNRSRHLAGYYILGVKDTRNVATGPPAWRRRLCSSASSFALDAYASAATAKRVRDQLRPPRQQVNGCDTLNAVASTVPGAKIIDIGTKRAGRSAAAMIRARGRTSCQWHRDRQCAALQGLGCRIVLLRACRKRAGRRFAHADREATSEISCSSSRSRCCRGVICAILRRDAVIDSRLAEQRAMPPIR